MKHFGENNMSRNLIQMTNDIFTELYNNVCDEHKELVQTVKRHILIDELYREECCDFLKKAIIIGKADEEMPVLAFVKYQGTGYIGVDIHYAEYFERYGYLIENSVAICTACQLLSLSERIYKMRVESKEVVDTCLGLTVEEGKDSVVFSPTDILDLIHEMTIFKMDVNSLEINLASIDDVLRIQLLLYIEKTENVYASEKEALINLLSMPSSKRISGNLKDFLLFKDNRIRFLSLYQCVEYLFIPNRAYVFHQRYNMALEDALQLHIQESMRRDERSNCLDILRYAGEVAIHKIYISLYGADESSNELERVNKWVYDTRCSIAHFRYGQSHYDEDTISDDMLLLMLELLNAIYGSLVEEIKHICSGSITISETST